MMCNILDACAQYVYAIERGRGKGSNMLRKLLESDFDRYAEKAYRLALNPLTSGYPTYSDGIKTKNDFMERSRKAFQRDNEDILLFEKNGIVKGWIHYYYLKDAHYLDTCSFCIEEGMDEALQEFVAYSHEHFPSSNIYLGFDQDNTVAVETLESLGFKCIEESYNDVLALASYTIKEQPKEILRITRSNYDIFASIHRQHTDMYWNTERILANIDQWMIFVSIHKDQVKGAIYLMLWEDKTMDEIFGIDFPNGIYNPKTYQDLLITVMNEEKRRNVKYLVFFNEEESQNEAIKCGFHCVGKYVCYTSWK